MTEAMQGRKEGERREPMEVTFSEYEEKTSTAILGEEDLKPVVALYWTIKKCVLCDETLKEKIPWNEDLKNNLESFCTFLNIALDQRHSWDFDQENYPFCHDCTSLLDYLHLLYKRLEELHTFVDLGVRKVRQKVSEVNKSTNTSFEDGTDDPRSLRKASSGCVVEYRAKFIRGLILSTSEDNDEVPIILPRLDKILGNLQAGETERAEIGVQANPLDDKVVEIDPTTSKVDVGVQTEINIFVKIDCDPEDGMADALLRKQDSSLIISQAQPLKAVSSREDDEDAIMLDEESNKHEWGVGAKENSNEKDYDIDEFPAFLEAEIAKRQRATLLVAQRSNGTILISKGATAKVTSKKVKKGMIAMDQQVEVRASVTNQPLVSNVQQINMTEESSDDEPDIIEIIEAKKGGAHPRRNLRPRKKVKYNENPVLTGFNRSDDFGVKNGVEMTIVAPVSPDRPKLKQKHWKIEAQSFSEGLKRISKGETGVSTQQQTENKTSDNLALSPSGTDALHETNHDAHVPHPEIMNSVTVPVTETPCLQQAPEVDDYEHYRILCEEALQHFEIKSYPENFLPSPIAEPSVFDEALENC